MTFRVKQKHYKYFLITRNDGVTARLWAVQRTQGRPVGTLNRSGIIAREDPSGFEYVPRRNQEAGHVQYAEVKGTIADVVPKEL